MLRGTTLLVAVVVGILMSASHGWAQARPRAIVLSFEGWRAAQARTAVTRALGEQYELISEEQAINTAAQIAVDVSTPEGMAAVVQRLGIELVVGGSVTGTGRRSSTTIFVLDRNGNEIGNGTGPGPTSRRADGPIGEAAVQACQTAMVRLHPPQPVTPPQQRVVAEEEVVPEDETPAQRRRRLRDIENERPGEHYDDEDDSGGRWRQPIFRVLAMADIRNRSAELSNPSGDVGVANYADFFPQWGLQLEARPFAQSTDALRGLYAYGNAAFSIGINYYSQYASLDLSAPSTPLQTFSLELGVGYAATIAESVELIGAVGFGYDSYSLTQPDPLYEGDLPSVGYPYLPILVGGRVRLLPVESETDLHLELMGGPRILFGGGGIAGTAATSDYFVTRAQGMNGCDTSGGCSGDYGAVSGVGLNITGGVGLTLDNGIDLGLRAQYVNYFLGFSGGSASREKTSGIDESVHIQILLGYALR